MTAMTEITCKCGCGRKRMVRTADVKRGWGKYFDKTCKAIHQTKTKGRNHYPRDDYDDAGEDGGLVVLSMEDMMEGNVQ